MPILRPNTFTDEETADREAIMNPPAAPVAGVAPVVTAPRTGTVQLTPAEAAADPAFAAEYGPFPQGSLIYRGPTRAPGTPTVTMPPWMIEQQQREQEAQVMAQIAQTAQGLPMAQAQKAIASAYKNLGIRRYADAVSSGRMTPQQAMSEFGRMIFYDDPKGFMANQPRKPAGVQEISVGGNKYVQVTQPTGNVTLRSVSQAPKSGPVQAVEVFAPGTTNAIAGMVGVPGAGGNFIVRDIPKDPNKPRDVTPMEEFNMLKSVNEALSKSPVGVMGVVLPTYTEDQKREALENKRVYNENVARMKELTRGRRVSAPAVTGGGGKRLTREIAAKFFKEAGYDPVKAQKLAEDAGYTF